jgi:hypothetical protein
MIRTQARRVDIRFNVIKLEIPASIEGVRVPSGLSTVMTGIMQGPGTYVFLGLAC